MKPKERQEQILHFLRATQRVWNVDELAGSFTVSPITIRRDLGVLEKSGVIIRTHGGCMSVVHSGFESAYQSKIAQHFSYKHAIGKYAARFVNDGDRILILDSSTTYHLASYLGGHRNLVVYTNSIAMITELSRFPEIDIFVLGGQYNRTMLFLEGSLTQNVVESTSFNKVFVSVDAIQSDGRCYVPNYDTARLFQVIFRKAKQKLLLSDHTKLKTEGTIFCCDLNEFDFWITTAGVDPQLLRAFGTKTEIHTVKA